ncbi:uncharacterized protein [Watersipora subatra]|uniref:uncharacterized protein n=1 Tax=Watersipora subatra TaxID=2589382 RepID=UPI00355C169A
MALLHRLPAFERVTKQDTYSLPKTDNSLYALSGSRYFSTLDLVSGHRPGLRYTLASAERGHSETSQGQTETKTVQIQTVATSGLLPGSHSKPGRSLYRPQQGKGSHGVAEPAQSERTPTISQDRRLLPTIYPGVSHYSTFLVLADCKRRALGMDKRGTDRLQQAERQYQHRPDLGLLRTLKAVHPGHKCQWMWTGSRAVISTGGLRESHCLLQQTLTPSEHNYCITRRELLAVVKAVKHFRPYLYDQEFLLQTDHASLRWLRRRREPANQAAQWLEILAVFWYVLKYRSGICHGNADGLSRKSCEDCRQCASIEQRDEGPSRKELAREQALLATWVPISCLDRTHALNRAGSTLGNVAYPGGPARNSHGTSTPTVARLNLSAGGSPDGLPAPPRKTGPKGKLAKTQATGQGPVAIMYRAIATGEEVPAEHLFSPSVALQGHARWCAICLPAMRETTGQNEWDLLLPQLMRAYRGTLHSATGDTANMLMLGRELRLPDQLASHPPPTELFSAHEHALEVQRRLQAVHEALRQSQMEVRENDQEEPPLYAPGNWVWLTDKRQRRGENPKLHAKFVGSYQVMKAWGNHTYLVERQGQSSIQSEGRLKPYHACPRDRSIAAPANTSEAHVKAEYKSKSAKALNNIILSDKVVTLLGSLPDCYSTVITALESRGEGLTRICPKCITERRIKVW